MIGVAALIFLWMKADFYIGKNISSRALKEYPLRKGSVEFFGNGSYYFSTLLKDVANAESHVHLAFYRFKHDSVGKEFLQLLKQKADDGIQIRLLLDFFGSVNFPQKEIRALKKRGVEFAYSHKPSLPLVFTSLNRRNHHKIIIIDGNVGYVGGFNIGDNYAEKNPRIGFWRDYMIKLVGSGVEDLQDQFLTDWRKTGKNTGNTESLFPKVRKGETGFKLLASNGGYLDNRIINFIQSARYEIIVGSPYFIPSQKVKRALLEARERGVEIKVIIPEKADHPFVKERAFSEFSSLLQKGIKLFLYKNGFYHAKIMLVDQRTAYVGTSNFDMRSFRTNDELILTTEDKGLLDKIEENLHEDLQHSEQQILLNVMPKNIFSKIKRVAAYLLSNFL